MPSRVFAGLALIGACLLLGAAPALADPAGPCSQAPSPGTQRLTLLSGGLERTALVHVPRVAAGRRLPVLIALHGAGGNGAAFEPYTGFSVLADDEGFIAVYPDAAGRHPFWSINDHIPGEANDVQFISDLLDRVEAMLCVDADRVYATGVSNGAGMAVRLACELSSRLAAIAPIAGGYKSQPPCHPDRPVSVIEVHGTSDAAVPYLGTPPHRAGAVQTFLADWRRRDVCRSTEQISRVAPRVLRLQWSHCADGTAVEHLEILRGAHQLPGGVPPDPGQSASISAPWEVWAFLRSHRRAPPYPHRS